MHTLPGSCDVLVVGAGPAGSACALALARRGLHVVLADAQVFPRDKVCGDALIPDAHAALRRLGVHDEVMAAAHPCHHVRCWGPGGQQVAVPGTLAVLARRQLDDILRRAALRAGAQWAAPLRFEAPLLDQGRVAGARLLAADGTPHELRARWTVLATGAAATPLQAAGLCQRRAPSGMSLRGHFQHAGLAPHLTELVMVWHRALAPAYGWIFPMGGGRFNAGVYVHGLHEEGGGKQALNLRHLLDRFAACHPDAATLLREGTLLAPLRGAPVRCTLQGSATGRPGLLATGEAIGSTYAFTGEGIGKAMETGLLAADALATGGSDAPVLAHYARAVDALRPRFEQYRRADIVNAHPWLVGFVIGRVRRSPRLLRRLAGVLDETTDPGLAFSAKGVWRLLTE